MPEQCRPITASREKGDGQGHGSTRDDRDRGSERWLVGSTVYYLTVSAPEANYDVVQQDLQSVVNSFVFPQGA